MSSYNLKRLLQPKSIALFGGLWIENVANQIKNSNFKGNVWPINPHRKSIAGYKCFQDISDLPGVPDTAFIGVNRTKTLEILTKLNTFDENTIKLNRKWDKVNEYYRT